MDLGKELEFLLKNTIFSMPAHRRITATLILTQHWMSCKRYCTPKHCVISASNIYLDLYNMTPFLMPCLTSLPYLIKKMRIIYLYGNNNCN